MRNKSTKNLFVVLMILFISACAAHQKKPVFPIHDLNPPVQSGKFVQSLDNFLVILDTSDSMSGTYAGKQKFETARETAVHMNRAIPEINLLGGLRIYGNTPSGNETELTYGFSGYTMARTMEDALYEVPGPGGKSPMGTAIQRAAEDLKPLQGKSAVILFSDGNVTDDPLTAAKAMKRDLGENVCIYTVHIGDNADGRRKMEEIFLAGECGFAEKAENMQSAAEMAAFVRKVFLSPVGEITEPVVVKEEIKPVPIPSDTDSDGDGVPDGNDACPETPRGVRVDERGCWIIENILFEYDKTEIRPEYFTLLEQLADVLKTNPALELKIEGHTDNVGSAGYNQTLSEKRALAVKSFLIKEGVMPETLESIAYGYSRPAAPNDTEEGRKLNRRVELEPMQVK